MMGGQMNEEGSHVINDDDIIKTDGATLKQTAKNFYDKFAMIASKIEQVKQSDDFDK